MGYQLPVVVDCYCGLRIFYYRNFVMVFIRFEVQRKEWFWLIEMRKVGKLYVLLKNTVQGGIILPVALYSGMLCI